MQETGRFHLYVDVLFPEIRLFSFLGNRIFLAIMKRLTITLAAAECLKAESSVFIHFCLFYVFLLDVSRGEGSHYGEVSEFKLDCIAHFVVAL